MAETPEFEAFKPVPDIVTTGEGRAFLKLLASFDLVHWTDWIGEWGISRAAFVSILFFAMLSIVAREVPHFGDFAFEWIFGTAPIWLPIGVGVGAWKVWIWYVRSLNLSKWKSVVLEMKLPRDIMKSPRAMEVALTNLWSNSGETTMFHRWWQGGVRAFYSFEIASIGGDVHFFIWCRDRDRRSIESAIYSQYPEVELHEVEDYAVKFQYDPKIHQCFATEHKLNPLSMVYPIKTYVDFELDKDPKEEFKVDPLASVLEFMGNARPEEQIWTQVIITLNKDKRRSKKGIGTEERWKGMIREEVEKLRIESSVFTGKVSEEDKKIARPRATWRQTRQIENLERHMGKLAYNVGIRTIYIAEKKVFNSPSVTGMRWLWRPFSWAGGMGNQLRPRYWHNPFDYPWQDFRDIRWNITTRRFIDAYRRRSWFYSPWISPHDIMSVESIASLWHPVGRTVVTPGLERIPAKKAEPPLNLPK